jgi:23S rRNA (uridine2552-2'-O)-methyltransferase
MSKTKPPQGPPQGPTGRRLRVHVRTARGRTVSSKQWLERQLNDPYVAAAKDRGFRSRAAFKLIEIDDKHRLLKKGGRIVDLGAAPGGWTQVAVDRTGGGLVIGIDISPMEPVPGAKILHLDFLDPSAPDQLRAELKGQADLVMSDMAAPATGHTKTDHMRIMGLCEAALDFAAEVLRPGGAFLAKVLRGGTEAGLLNRLKRDFAQVQHIKPPASRADSAEMYVLAKGFRGGALTQG